jgi:hypothetical protein
LKTDHSRITFNTSINFFTTLEDQSGISIFLIGATLGAAATVSVGVSIVVSEVSGVFFTRAEDFFLVGKSES